MASVTVSVPIPPTPPAPAHHSPGCQNCTPSCLLGTSIWMSHSTSDSLCLKQNCLPPSLSAASFAAFPSSQHNLVAQARKQLGVTLTCCSSSLAPSAPCLLQSHNNSCVFSLLHSSYLPLHFHLSPMFLLAQAATPLISLPACKHLSNESRVDYDPAQTPPGAPCCSLQSPYDEAEMTRLLWPLPSHMFFSYIW